jgi:hypothetical protein
MEEDEEIDMPWKVPIPTSLPADTTAMPVVSRMIADINRRTLTKKSIELGFHELQQQRQQQNRIR